jgi:hypothetical protein
MSATAFETSAPGRMPPIHFESEKVAPLPQSRNRRQAAAEGPANAIAGTMATSAYRTHRGAPIATDWPPQPLLRSPDSSPAHGRISRSRPALEFPPSPVTTTTLTSSSTSRRARRRPSRNAAWATSHCFSWAGAPPRRCHTIPDFHAFVRNCHSPSTLYRPAPPSIRAFPVVVAKEQQTQGIGGSKLPQLACVGAS